MTITSNIQSNLAIALVGVVIVMTSLWQPVSSHGRLVNPPSRSSMWRFGFDTPPNYQDNELFCGGFQHQMSLGYKCGLCGDPWDGVRENEAGGIYATGQIVAEYSQGEDIVITVHLTANHKGWFEFKLCPTNDALGNATQDCLDLYPLDLSDDSGTKLYVEGLGSVEINVPVRLPASLNCDLCVLQWHYHAGNNWGTDPDGTSCVGCGYQEEFYGCADVAILASDDDVTTKRTGSSTSSSTTPIPTNSHEEEEEEEEEGGEEEEKEEEEEEEEEEKETTTSTTTSPSSSSRSSSSSSSTSTTTTTRNPATLPRVLQCRSLYFIPGLQQWCDTNCNLDFCPPTHCACVSVPEPRALELPEGCYAKSPFLNWPGIDSWCGHNCPSGVCLDNRCFCVD